MNKLIKLSDTHYIVVDNSEIKESDLFYSENERGIVKALIPLLQGVDTGNFKITYSTQPLEEIVWWEKETRRSKLGFDKIKLLTLSEVEEVINGYSVEKMAEKSVNIAMTLKDLSKTLFMTIYKKGFKAHQELIKDKLFISKENIKPLQDLVNEGYDPHDSAHHLQVQRMLKTIKQVIQSLLPKTEWNIEFDKQGKIKLI